MRNRFFIFCFISFLNSCNQSPESNSLFSLASNTGINFTNSIHNSKDFNIFSYRNFYNGGGVAIGDINNDGLADVFFTANMGPNKLFLNLGDMKFTDVSAKAGFVNKQDWSTGVVMADVNHDGWLDIYVCNAGYAGTALPQNRLFINNKDLTFSDQTAKYGLENKGGYCTHTVFFDYDLDGDLDCYILNNSFIPVNTLNYANKRELRAANWPVADFLKGGGDKLMRNDNDSFVDVSEAAGIYGSLIGFGLGVNVGDVNGDFFPDLYISNDFFERDYLYINQQDGTFKESLESLIGHTSLASMGADIADINNDGHPDIFTTDMLPDDDYRLRTTSTFDNYDVYTLKEKSGFYHQYMQNCLQLNDGSGKFKEIAHFSGVSASDWSWGALMFDADNDGWNDIYVCNGIFHDVTDQDFINFFANEVNQKMVLTGKKEDVNAIISKMPSKKIKNKFFKNLGNLKFSDNGDEAGFSQPSFSNGAAYGDLDNDGDLDLVVNNVNEPSFVYKNNSEKEHDKHSISILLKGTGKNSYAIGSVVKLYAGNKLITRELHPGRGFQSSIDYKMVMGLGNTRQVDSLVIVWPGKTVSTFLKPSLDTLHIIQQPAHAPSKTVMSQLPGAWDKQMELVEVDFDKHIEDEYVDFYAERLVPVLESRKGPAVAIADVNADGLEDIFIGGAVNQEAKIYMQMKDGFVKRSMPDFALTAEYEDVSATFFDADADGDLDLLVVSGGNHEPVNSRTFQNRLYLNDGIGNFQLSDFNLPETGMNGSVVAANDIDEDGDIDIFIGSGSEPGNYGKVPLSCMLENNGAGAFIDVTKSKYPELLYPGMVNAAIWVDVNGDNNKELVLAGDWMCPKLFSFKKGKLTALKTSLEPYSGWWKSVLSRDVDGDGDNDLLLGNVGKNFYLQPSSTKPLKMWYEDFDQNGSADKIITRTYQGKDMPVFMKRELEEQMPSLKKKNLQFSDFGNKSISDLWAGEILNKASVFTMTTAASCVAFNDGKGTFSIAELPTSLQLSSIESICFMDVDMDGTTDMVTGGNCHDYLPQFGRQDASGVEFLRGITKEKIISESTNTLSLGISGVVKHLKEVKGPGQTYFLVVRNNEVPLLFKLKDQKTGR